MNDSNSMIGDSDGWGMNEEDSLYFLIIDRFLHLLLALASFTCDCCCRSKRTRKSSGCNFWNGRAIYCDAASPAPFCGNTTKKNTSQKLKTVMRALAGGSSCDLEVGSNNSSSIPKTSSQSYTPVSHIIIHQSVSQSKGLGRQKRNKEQRRLQNTENRPFSIIRNILGIF